MKVKSNIKAGLELTIKVTSDSAAATASQSSVEVSFKS
jgi:hypothetical protein